MDGAGQKNNDTSRFARPAQIGPFGNLDCECKTVIDAVTLEAFDKKARASGFGDRSKLLRNLAYLVAHGKSFDKLMAEAADRRTRLLLGEGLELAQELQALTVRGEVSA